MHGRRSRDPRELAARTIQYSLQRGNRGRVLYALPHPTSARAALEFSQTALRCHPHWRTHRPAGRRRLYRLMKMAAAFVGRAPAQSASLLALLLGTAAAQTPTQDGVYLPSA